MLPLQRNRATCEIGWQWGCSPVSFEGRSEWDILMGRNRKGALGPMKLEITINLKETDGVPVTEATTIEVEVPDFEAFTGPARFGEVFDAYEREVIKARNEAVAVATEKYLSEMAKKKQSQREISEKEK